MVLASRSDLTFSVNSDWVRAPGIVSVWGTLVRRRGDDDNKVDDGAVDDNNIVYGGTTDIDGMVIGLCWVVYKGSKDFRLQHAFVCVLSL
jgi:hypothetical protein